MFKIKKHIQIITAFIILLFALLIAGCSNSMTTIENKITGAFSYRNEIDSVSTKYSALYKDGIGRKMILFTKHITLHF